MSRPGFDQQNTQKITFIVIVGVSLVLKREDQRVFIISLETHYLTRHKKH